MTLCCTKTRRDLDCEAGRLAALAGEECGVEGAGESHRDCCLSCSLGILNNGGRIICNPASAGKLQISSSRDSNESRHNGS